MPPRQDASVKTAESIAPEEFGPYIVYERLGVGGMAYILSATKRRAPFFQDTIAVLKGDEQALDQNLRATGD